MAPRRPSAGARSGASVFRARTAGVDSLLRDADLSTRQIVRDTRDAFQDAEAGIERAYRTPAPVESGRMRDSVFARTDILSGGRVQLRVTIDGAVDPKTGYDYLRQSRFGRGPVRAKTRPMVLSKRRNKAGVPGYRYAGRSGLGFSVVAGFTPKGGDWVEAGERLARVRLTRLQNEVGQRIGRHGLLRTRGA